MRLQLEVRHDDWPRSVIVRKQRSVTRSAAGRGIERRLARSEERSHTPTKQEANDAVALVKCFPWDELRCFSMALSCARASPCFLSFLAPQSVQAFGSCLLGTPPSWESTKHDDPSDAKPRESWASGVVNLDQ
ncbi:hypothetical protein TcBrA4_0044920 [Trypanosoma cruzi]|nr:hypothetical protein TcBrA4_0044920 [Trypanosoma cruzi]